MQTCARISFHICHLFTDHWRGKMSFLSSGKKSYISFYFIFFCSTGFPRKKFLLGVYFYLKENIKLSSSNQMNFFQRSFWRLNRFWWIDIHVGMKKHVDVTWQGGYIEVKENNLQTYVFLMKLLKCFLCIKWYDISCGDSHPQFTLRTSSEIKNRVLRTSSEIKK